MNTLLQILLESVEELENCIHSAKKAILESHQDDAVVTRLNFYDEALDKITREVESIEMINESEPDCDIEQSIKRIVELSNMIRQDSLDLLLSLETGFDSTVDVDNWN